MKEAVRAAPLRARQCMRPSATSVGGLKLLVYEALEEAVRAVPLRARQCLFKHICHTCS